MPDAISGIRDNSLDEDKYKHEQDAEKEYGEVHERANEKPRETKSDRNRRKHANEDACCCSSVANAKNPKHLRFNRDARA